MGLFRRRTATPPQPTSPPEPPPSLWRDAFGRLATRGVQIIVVLVVSIAIIWGMREVSVVVIPVILALIFASAFSPFMGWLRDRGLPSIAATIVALLSIVAVLTGLIWLIVWQVSSQWETLAKKAVEGYDVLVKWAQQLDLPIVIDQQQLDEWIEAAKDFLFSAQFGSGAIAGISAVASFVTGFVLMVVILFFFLRDGKKIWEFLIRPFRGEQDARARRIGNKTVDTLGAYVRGTAAVAAVDAIGIGIGLLICQVPLAIPLAVLVFILAFIPIVGATLAGILAALVALVAQGPIIALIVVAIVIGVNQLEGNFLQPVLMGRTLKLHSLVILVALAIGTVLGGVLGAVLAVPITAVAWGIVQVWDGDNLPARWARKKPEVETS